MKIRALQNVDSFNLGDEADVGDSYGKALVQKKLAVEVTGSKSAPLLENKMKAAPENKKPGKKAKD